MRQPWCIWEVCGPARRLCMSPVWTSDLFVSQFQKVLTSLPEFEHKWYFLLSFYWPSCCCFSVVAHVTILSLQGLGCPPYSGVSFERVESIYVSQVLYYASISFLYKFIHRWMESWDSVQKNISNVLQNHSSRLLEHCILHHLLKKLYMGNPHPKVQTFTLLCAIFWQKRQPFYGPLLHTIVEMLHLVSFIGVTSLKILWWMCLLEIFWKPVLNAMM